jgi:hypothetical protein
MTKLSLTFSIKIQNHKNHGVFTAAYFGGSPELDNTPNHQRTLAASYAASHLSQNQYNRQLLIGGGSEPRSTIHFDRCQFVNNSLTDDIIFPTLASNGPINIVSSFADVTITNSLFKDSYYEFNRQIAVSTVQGQSLSTILP